MIINRKNLPFVCYTHKQSLTPYMTVYQNQLFLSKKGVEILGIKSGDYIEFALNPKNEFYILKSRDKEAFLITKAPESYKKYYRFSSKQLCILFKEHFKVPQHETIIIILDKGLYNVSRKALKFISIEIKTKKL